MEKKLSLTSQIESIRRAELSLERLVEWIPRHDTKASVLFGVQAGMIGAIAASIAPPGALTSIESYLVLITASLLVVSIVFNGFGMLPNVLGPKESLIFFCSIAAKSYREFQNRWLRLSDDDYLGDLLEQIHVNSLIAAKKFLWLKKSYIFLAIATLPWATTIYLLHQ